MKTRVANMRDLPPRAARSAETWPAGHVYIGRRFPWMAKEVPGASGMFGNPFKSDGSRENLVEAYDRYLRVRIVKDPSFRAAVAGLRGMTLVCWCKPKACHGDALARVADELGGEGGA